MSSYVIRVVGVVGPELRAELADLDVVIEPARTVLRGQVVDQAALRGLLDRLEHSGLDILELRRLPDPEPATESVSPRTGAAR